MTEFKARVEGEKVILETVNGNPLHIREVIVKYSVTSLSPTDERGRRVISEENVIEKTVNKLEIPTRGLEVIAVSVIFKKGDFTLREDLSI
ncbi:hypothetical protein [Metallosphaera hakonensis]|uniref:Uncharacterized protein n=1 Tax=Metallosphaera hakonensis JCM 8857 = DSM 7519 TaxID=1293036 RepID=A0A2U9IVA3_9CREN|nr:hypothetical protein [Metallosphaera hakonensis]AWR99989.1 hypothetical protein DFR87_10190 [Metallosphaera hakonensis JCM 8857 = DSM 7519]